MPVLIMRPSARDIFRRSAQRPSDALGGKADAGRPVGRDAAGTLPERILSPGRTYAPRIHFAIRREAFRKGQASVVVVDDGRPIVLGNAS